MSGRLVAIVVVLAVMAFAEIRRDTEALTAARASNAAVGQLADPTAPEPDVPAIITAAVSASATVQSALVVESRRQPSPIRIFIVGHHLPVVTHTTGEPRFLPLLI